MPIDAGELDRRIRIEQQLAGRDDWNTPTGSWGLLASRAAKFIPGTGTERREAAQTAATRTATFRIRRDSVTRAVTPKHRLRFNEFGVTDQASPIWDIKRVDPLGRDALEITATSLPNQEQ